MRAPCNVGEGLVDGDALDGRREIAQDGDGGVAETLIRVEVTADEDEVGTELPREAAGHAAPYTESSRFIGRREDHAAANGNRPVAQAGVEQLFDGRIEGVEVRVQNGCGGLTLRILVAHGERMAKVLRLGKSADGRMRTARGAAGVLLLAALGCLGCEAPGVEIEFRAGHAFSRRERQAIRDVAERAVVDARRHLPALPGHLRITVQAGSKVIPETGETGGTGLPGAVYWTVDPAHPGGVVAVVNAQLRATLLHEWYHLVREATLPANSLVDRAVSEGLATSFERDVGGGAVPWGDYPAEADAWTAEFLALPTDAPVRHWMHRHPDGRRWIGYKVGTRLADRARRASGLSLTELATVRTDRIVAWATGAPVPEPTLGAQRRLRGPGSAPSRGHGPQALARRGRRRHPANCRP
jgi:hypothetical protein